MASSSARPSSPSALRYLVTSYGKGAKGSAGNQLEAQHVLAHAMSYVHDNALLTRTHVREAMHAYAGGNPPIYAALAQADLDAQIELVKLTPLPQSPEEISKLWAALNQTYRLSVAYEATAVLVERRRPAKTAPPVRSTGLYVVPLARPVIEALSPLSLTVDDALVIRGRNLRAPDALVRFAGGDADPATTKIGEREILVEQLPDGLRAGPNVVTVVHDIRMGQAPAPGELPPLHRGFESNAGLFTLQPAIRTALPQGNPKTVPRDSELTLTVDPPVGRTQRAALLLGGVALETRVVPEPPASVPDPASELTFHIPSDHPTGVQLIQVRVDGGESALELETDESDPLFNQYVAPKVKVT